MEATQPASTRSVQPHNEKARAVWNAPRGRYDQISRSIADAIEHAVERLQPTTGERILDLATGTGWASRIVAHRFPGTVVTGVDIAEQMLAYARPHRGDARAPHRVPPRRRRAAPVRGRLARRDRLDLRRDVRVEAGGRGVRARARRAARWTRRARDVEGRRQRRHMFGVMKKFMPSPPQPPPHSPFAWGKIERITELLGGSFDLAFETGTNHYRYGSGEQAWNLWVNHYGPAKTLAESLDDAKREEFKRAMIAWHETFASPLGFDQPRAYVITRAIRK